MSSLASIGGIVLWVVVLALPLLIYFLIEGFQSEHPHGKNPNITLGPKHPESEAKAPPDEKREAG
jgi:hypothetical protein